MPVVNLHSNCDRFNPAKARELIREAMHEMCWQLELMLELGEKDPAWKRAYDRLSASFDKVDEADFYLPH